LRKAFSKACSNGSLPSSNAPTHPPLRFGPHSAETLQRGGSAQPWPVRPFLEIAFDEFSIVAAVTVNQAEAKAGEVIAPSSRPSGLVTRQTARIARRLDLICAAAAGSSTGKSASGGSAEDDEH
jgi:hypothetical protein